MEGIKLSIIIPVYNAEKTLDRCLNSILDQEFDSFEVILVDDGSKDASASICDRYAVSDSRFVVKHQSNSGVSTSRNAGLDMARGEYVMFVDSDDALIPYALEDIFKSVKAVINGIQFMILSEKGQYFICPLIEFLL